MHTENKNIDNLSMISVFGGYRDSLGVNVNSLFVGISINRLFITCYNIHSSEKTFGQHFRN